MLKFYDNKVFYDGEKYEVTDKDTSLRDNTLAYQIMSKHNVGTGDELNIKFDALASHDITYVGIIQSAMASGIEKFPIPYVLTNCHNSLCAVGGTINSDDHNFGLSAVKRFGGEFVPAHIGVIHQYMREMYAGCGKMILGSDSHTRYGALGTMAIGEGGGELVKQLLNDTYNVNRPEVIAIYLDNELNSYAGPMDVALSLIGTVYEKGLVKNKVLEFIGPGIKSLSIDYRNAIDVMTTETTCLSSIWETDEKVKEFLTIHNRGNEYAELKSTNSLYDGMVYIDLSKVEPMIALPFHPSNVYTIEEVQKNPKEIFEKVNETARKLYNNNNIDFDLTSKITDKGIQVDQAVIGGCAGGLFENVIGALEILGSNTVSNNSLPLNVYPSSQAEYFELSKKGYITELLGLGATVKTAICGPCFGAGDVPSNHGFSIRHNTRNFPNREGAKPGEGQVASVALMDAKSIAATYCNGGYLQSAKNVAIGNLDKSRTFDKKIYDTKVINCVGKPNKDEPLIFAPSITPWPEILPMTDNILLKVASYITDEVTTTDELIPSGDTSSFRSNPEKLASFALSRKDPLYVERAKEIREIEKLRKTTLNDGTLCKELEEFYGEVVGKVENVKTSTLIGSVVCAKNPGDGSAREQAASVQKVLGGFANISTNYATKRYRSNCVNWGLIPFIIDVNDFSFEIDEYILVKGIKDLLASDKEEITAYVLGKNSREIQLRLPNISDLEREILLNGGLINYYKTKNK